MKCRYCASLESKVIDSRPTEDGTAIRRRRECINCGKRFTTYEKIEDLPIMVVKRDGRREPFDSDKIRVGIRKACEKRPIPADVQDKLVEEICREVFSTLKSEISSTDIGEIVMDKLKPVEIGGGSEVVEVGRAFNTMRARISRYLTERSQLFSARIVSTFTW